jgi:hypothetical protein
MIFYCMKVVSRVLYLLNAAFCPFVVTIFIVTILVVAVLVATILVVSFPHFRIVRRCTACVS